MKSILPSFLLPLCALFAVLIMATEQSFANEPAAQLDPGNGGGTSSSMVPGCVACNQCRSSAGKTSTQCTNIDEQLTACNGKIAQAQGIALAGGETSSQLGIMKEAFGTASTCLADVTGKIDQCDRLVNQCDSTCSAAMTWLEQARVTSGTNPVLAGNIEIESGAINSRQTTCEQGHATLAQLETARAALVAQNAQLIQAIMLLGPSVLELLMTSLGSSQAADLCAALTRDLGADHTSTEAACGPAHEVETTGGNDNGDTKDRDFAGSGEGGDQNMDLTLGNQEYNGLGGNERRNSSKVKEQSVQSSSSGGGPMMGGGGSSASGPTSKYEGAQGARGFNTNIMGDPQGNSAGRRGAASQGGRSQSQWLQGQQAGARAQAEAHKRAAEAAAQRKRELRGPHAQGLFESVSETYRRYQHEMMQ